jgi:DNA-binding LytR/AlgR family response regulator
MIRCLVIDDEPFALEQLSGYIKQTKGLNLTAQCQSAVHALDILKQTAIDLMFVDINMPDLNGMDFVKLLKDPPKVIFTTAYSEYALEGFRVEAIDYLLKPISYSDFLKAAERAEAWFEHMQAPKAQVSSKDQFLFIKSEYKIVRIRFEDIKFIESMREYVRIHLVNEKPVMTLSSMKKLEETLPGGDFMRVHRSYIVNLNKITTIERNRIIFDDKFRIPVSEQYKESFQKYLNNNFLL